jgi:hypothetical protein
MGLDRKSKGRVQKYIAKRYICPTGAGRETDDAFVALWFAFVPGVLAHSRSFLLAKSTKSIRIGFKVLQNGR